MRGHGGRSFGAAADAVAEAAHTGTWAAHLHLQGLLQVWVRLGPGAGDGVVLKDPVPDLVVVEAEPAHHDRATAATTGGECRRGPERVAKDV